MIAALLALANDSGVVAGATAYFPTVLLILIALPCSDKTGAKISKVRYIAQLAVRIPLKAIIALAHLDITQ